MDLLVLGGTRFVGRAVIAAALARGWQVSAVHRGINGSPPEGTESILVDRTDGVALAAALGRRRWDLVVDTWSGAPRVAAMAAAMLTDNAQNYGYISSGSVYVWGAHTDESSPLIAGDPDAADGGYAALKRGAELGIQAAFPDALLARAGLILGPYEDIGRLPWWLYRIARGGPVVAPGRPQRPLQYVDVRDLAEFTLAALEADLTGAVDVIGPSGSATTATLLQTCIDVTRSSASLRWIGEAELSAAGVEPWTQLPCWVPENGDYAGFLEVDTSHAAASGLAPRPLQETVADTWQWLQRAGRPAQREDRDVHGLPEEVERRLLAT